jgi:hypothetical protein
MSSLNQLRQKALRNIIGNQCLGSVGLAIHGTNVENVLTANAVSAVINGVIVAIAADTEVDISAEKRLVSTSTEFAVDVWALAAAAGGFGALAIGYSNIYVVMVNASGTYGIVEGTAVAGTTLPDYPNTPDEDWCPICAIGVVNASAAAFTLGTTSLATAGITDTYINLNRVPGN